MYRPLAAAVLALALAGCTTASYDPEAGGFTFRDAMRNRDLALDRKRWDGETGNQTYESSLRYHSRPETAIAVEALGLARDVASGRLVGRLRPVEPAPEPAPEEPEELVPGFEPSAVRSAPQPRTYHVAPSPAHRPVPVLMDGKVTCAVPLEMPLLVPDAQGRPGWVDVQSDGFGGSVVSDWQPVRAR